VGFGLVGFALSFEFGTNVCDVLGCLVLGILDVLFAFLIDHCDFLYGFVPGRLEALVTVLADGGEVDIEVLECGDVGLLVKSGGLLFPDLYGLLFCPSFEVCCFVFNELFDAGFFFKRGGLVVMTSWITWSNAKLHLEWTHSMTSLLNSWVCLLRIVVIAASIIWPQVSS
jgi:hypothetical protein